MVNTINKESRVSDPATSKWRMAAILLGLSSLVLLSWALNLQNQLNSTSSAHNSHMMMRDLGAADADYDKRFIDAMIPHHEGAIVMSKDALDKARHPELKSLAQNIIEAQRREIEQLQQWRNSWY